MLKRDELANPNSCLNRAANDEWVFVLREHDDTFPEMLREWAKKRIERGKNTPDDRQIKEALETADLVDRKKSKEKV